MWQVSLSSRRGKGGKVPNPRKSVKAARQRSTGKEGLEPNDDDEVRADHEPNDDGDEGLVPEPDDDQEVELDGDDGSLVLQDHGVEVYDDDNVVKDD